MDDQRCAHLFFTDMVYSYDLVIAIYTKSELLHPKYITALFCLHYVWLNEIFRGQPRFYHDFKGLA